MRKPIIAGNWKMNKTIKEGLDLVKQIKSIGDDTDVEVVVCVPSIELSEIKNELKESNVLVGAQNMHFEESGAFTGEISPLMLKDMKIDYCIIGHSERRQYFNETDETVNKKIKAALKHDIKPILCIGETLEERESGKEKDVVKNQLLKALDEINSNDALNIVVAYEPIWAIGTGKTASTEDAGNMASFIRSILEEKYGLDTSEEIRIQYGGSVKPSNVTDIMNQYDIDGALVGGASLKADDFIQLVRF